VSVLLRTAASALAGIGAGNPYLEAEYLLARAWPCDRTSLLRRSPREVVADDISRRWRELLDRRLTREPLQYVLGGTPFCELDLLVGPGVLIPRSETETLVDLVFREIRIMDVPPGLLVDVGTGSGAILLALLRRLPGWTGLGSDLSPAALAWADRNRRACGSKERAHLLRCDLTAAVRGGSAQVVVSNPPYIATSEMELLQPEIRLHEPWLALDGGGDGLVIARRVVRDARRLLRDGGLLAMELAAEHPPLLSPELQRAGFVRWESRADLAGRMRFLLAWLPGRPGHPA